MMALSQLSRMGGNFPIQPLTEHFGGNFPVPETGYMKAPHHLLLETGVR